ncbi:S8 family serine peptidase [Yinghuangia soli]|uniref:S8 family serine peptidase n=1 Tax=Yinghuangia soli TaxID=2908204 RepID=A0AA41U5V8_9ACTN|nr:S8 family serine peptidase [Yinghuangia soli]MCF2530369.1 S8 family serine peptidase [Yinghuangia soli]
MARRLFGARRFPAVLAAGALAVGAGLLGGGIDAASGAPPGAGGPAYRATGPAPGSGSATVTLITGDRVTASTGADGKRLYTVAPGPGRGKITFVQRAHGTSTSVVPSDALPLLERKLLDPRLFDIPGLLRQGYDDRATQVLPLIVKYADGSAPARTSLARSAQPGRELPSIGAQAMAERKADAGQFWQSVRSAAPGGANLAPGVARIWLDARVRATLDRSVAQVGAPQAWQAGFTGTGVTTAILDTGIDAAHPDLDDAIAEAVDFSDSPTGTADLYGHGTHVASIITGDGSAAQGKYKGVAPDTRLVIGKVLGDDGRGEESDIIAGMEWAAARAKVVNMSLGSDYPTDGTDPMSLAVNALSGSTGSLFVISAGNAGQWGDSSIGSPGAADAALTVGAVDADDRVAPFSSRGPRFGDRAFKPEISAPGVEIAAARASGTSMGHPVDENYTRASGTSMAAPHVAGAAAILAQRHPDWTGQQLKGALVAASTVVPDDNVWGQGVGRLDVAAAVGSRVSASPASISADVRWPYPGNITRTVTYRNDGDQPVVLDLAATVDKTAAAAGTLIGVTPARLSVPARGTAEATVTFTPTTADAGVHGGRLTATGPDGKAVARTGIALSVEAEAYDLKIKFLDRKGGQPEFVVIQLINTDIRADYPIIRTPDGYVARVPKGAYALSTLIPTGTPEEAPDNWTAAGVPRLALTGDTSLAFDARAGRPSDITADTPKAAVVDMRVLGIRAGIGDWALTWTAHVFDPAVKLYAIPTNTPADPAFAVRVGSFRHTEPAATDPGRKYHLMVSHNGSIPADPSVRLRVADLAVAEVRVHDAGAAGTAEFTRGAYWDGDEFAIGLNWNAPVPGTWKEYMTAAPDLGWYGVVEGKQIWEIGDLTRFPARRTTIEAWNKAAFGPQVEVQVCDAALRVTTRPFSPSGKGHTAAHPRGLAKVTLLRDGVELSSFTDYSGELPGLTADKAVYTLRLTARQFNEPTEADEQVDAEWTLTAQAGGCEDGEAAWLPVVRARIDGDFDLRNATRAGVPHTLRASFERTDGTPVQVRDPRFEASYDGGRTWQRLPSVPNGQGHIAVAWPPRSTSGYVALRVTARDAAGNTLTQTATHAYLVTGPPAHLPEAPCPGTDRGRPPCAARQGGCLSAAAALACGGRSRRPDPRELPWSARPRRSSVVGRQSSTVGRQSSVVDCGRPVIAGRCVT